MFTITHKLMDGTQQVFSAIEVQFLPRTEANGESAGVHLLCGPGEGGPGVRCGHFNVGTIFVMNDKGATVASYYLDKAPDQPK